MTREDQEFEIHEPDFERHPPKFKKHKVKLKRKYRRERSDNDPMSVQPNDKDR
jgi:hypothetical protein